MLDRELPGVAEAIRAAGRAATSDRGAQPGARRGRRHARSIVNLPGLLAAACATGSRVLEPLLPHLLDQLARRRPRREGHEAPMAELSSR